MRRQIAVILLGLILGLSTLRHLTILHMAVHAIIQNNRRRRYMNLLLDSGKLFQAIKQNRNARQRKPRKHWIRPGRTSSWWDNFSNKIVIRTTGPDRFHTVPCKQRPIRSGSVRNGSGPVPCKRSLRSTMISLTQSP